MAMTFETTKAYSLISCIGIAVIAVVLVLVYRGTATEDLKKTEELHNAALAKKLSSKLLPKYHAFIQGAAAIPADQLARQPEIVDLRLDVLNEVSGLDVVKVKIYDLGGLTVFSSERGQIGEEKGGNPGFQSARAGQAASELSFRNKFSAFEQVISDRNLASSYVPARLSDSGRVDGVFEIYSDVTPQIKQIERTGYIITAVVVVFLLILHFFLLLVVRRTEVTIRNQAEHHLRLELERRQKFESFTERK